MLQFPANLLFLQLANQDKQDKHLLYKWCPHQKKDAVGVCWFGLCCGAGLCPRGDPPVCRQAGPGSVYLFSEVPPLLGPYFIHPVRPGILQIALDPRLERLVLPDGGGPEGSACELGDTAQSHNERAALTAGVPARPGLPLTPTAKSSGLTRRRGEGRPARGVGAGGQRLRRGAGGPGRPSAAVAAGGGSSGRGRARRKPCRGSSSTVSLRGRDGTVSTAATARPLPEPSPARRYLCGRGPRARAQHHHAMLGASPPARRFRGSRLPSCGRGGAGERLGHPGRGAARGVPSAAGPLRTGGARGVPVSGRVGHCQRHRGCCRPPGWIRPRPALAAMSGASCPPCPAIAGAALRAPLAAMMSVAALCNQGF